MKTVIILIILLLAGCSVARDYQLEDLPQAEALIERAVYLMREDKLFEAQKNFELAFEVYPLAAAKDGLGCVALMQGKFVIAERLFWEAYEMDNTYNNSLANLALLYELQGKRELASEMFMRAVTEDPKNFKARNNYAAYLADNFGINSEVYGQLSKAQALYNHRLIYDNIERIRTRYEKIDQAN